MRQEYRRLHINKGGRDVSPQLSLTGIPEGTKSISIIMDDPDAIKPAKKIWVHWNVFNISVSGSDYILSAGEKPNGLVASGDAFVAKLVTILTNAWLQAFAGWGGRDRTCESRDQNPLPYRLATPHLSTPPTYRNTTP